MTGVSVFLDVSPAFADRYAKRERAVWSCLGGHALSLAPLRISRAAPLSKVSPRGVFTQTIRPFGATHNSRAAGGRADPGVGAEMGRDRIADDYAVRVLVS